MDTLSLTTGAARLGVAPRDDGDFKARALMLRASRQVMLASNIANADTPGYNATDINFRDALQSAMEAQVPLAGTNASHLSGASFQMSTAALAEFSLPAQSSLDGNSVDMDRERGEFARNAILYQLASAMLDDEAKEFKLASSDPRR
jgi:flagellar basal-body rod protein FlgB